LRVYLTDSDPDKTYFWLECVRAQLSNKDIEDNDRYALLRLLLDQLSMAYVSSDKTFAFYLCYAMRTFFTLGVFDAKNMKMADSIYKRLDKRKVLEMLDIHFFWQRLHGYPKKFDRIFEQARLQLTNSTSKPVIHVFMAIEKAQLYQDYTELSLLNIAPKQVVRTSWDELPWFKWQWNTMHSIIKR
jgi:hypothetical protein